MKYNQGFHRQGFGLDVFDFVQEFHWQPNGLDVPDSKGVVQSYKAPGTHDGCLSIVDHRKHVLFKLLLIKSPPPAHASF